MNRKELVKHAADLMHDGNIRKPVHLQKKVIHISDDGGNKKSFTISEKDSAVLYTADDIEAILSACISVVKEALKRGESVSIRGFGTLGLNYRKARRTKHPDTGEDIDIAGRYVPKFISGNDLRMCARLYELNKNEGCSGLCTPDDYDIDECHEDKE